MGNVELDFFGVPLAVVVSFILLEFVLFDIFYFSSSILLLFSFILFLAGLVFMRVAEKGGLWRKEAYFTAFSGIFIYFSVFEIPIFLGFIALKTSGYVFLILFLLFIAMQGGSFKSIIINIFIMFLLIAKMLLSVGKPTFAYLSILTTIALSLSLFIAFTFSKRKLSFEKELFLQFAFSTSVIVALWGIARIVR